MGKKIYSRVTGPLLFFSALFLIIHRVFTLWKNSLPDYYVLYHSAVTLFHGGNPYPGKLVDLNYPIFTLIFYFPFTILPFTLSEKLFSAVSMLSLILIIFVSLKILKKFSIKSFLLFTSLALLAFPTSFALGMGQSNLIAYLFLLTSLYQFLQKRSTQTGLFLFLAIVLKPILVFIIVFYFFQRAWKSLLLCLMLLAIGAILLPLIFVSASHTPIIQMIFTHAFSPHGKEVYYNQGLSGFTARLMPKDSIRTILYTIFSLVTLLSTVFLIKLKKLSQLHTFSLLLVTLVLIDPLSWQHHFVFLYFPFVFALFQIKNISKSLLYVLLTISFFLISINISNPITFSGFRSLFLSHDFFAASILFCTLLISGIYKKIFLNQRLKTYFYLLFLAIVLIDYIVFILCRAHVCLG